MAKKLNDEQIADIIGSEITTPSPRMQAAFAPNLPATRPTFDCAMLHRRNLDAATLDVHTSLPMATAEHKKELANVLNCTSDTLQRQINRELDIVHVTVTPHDWLDKVTGETRPGVRVIITTAQGESFSLGGDSPVRAITRLAAIYAPIPFNPPLRVRVKPVPIDSEKSTYTLEVV